MKRTKSLRRYTLKRAKQNRQAEPVRSSLVDEVGSCEWCGRDCGKIDVHEISQGSSRLASLQERSCVLVLGRGCHDVLHRMPDKRQCGLALLYLCRPGDFSLSRFWQVTGRRMPDQREVDLWIERLTRATK